MGKVVDLQFRDVIDFDPLVSKQLREEFNNLQENSLVQIREQEEAEEDEEVEEVEPEEEPEAEEGEETEQSPKYSAN